MNEIISKAKSKKNKKWENISDSEQFNVLREALNSNDTRQIKKSVKQGIDINVSDEFGNSNILMYYIQNRNRLNYYPEKIIPLFIKLGLDLNHQRHARLDATSALHSAVDKKYPDIIKILINSGAKIDLKDVNGNTPLINAAINYSLDKRLFIIILYLMAKGADSQIENYNGECAHRIMFPPAVKTG